METAPENSVERSDADQLIASEWCYFPKRSLPEVTKKGVLPTIFLLGPPASGKRILAWKLKRAYDFFYISMGQLLRKKNQQSLGQHRQINAAPELASQDLIFNLLRDAMKMDSKRGRPYLIHGFPTDVEQYIRFIRELGPCQAAVSLELPDNVTIQRLEARERNGSRVDDRPGIARKRLDVFHAMTEPLMEHLEQTGKLKRMDAQKSPNVLLREVLQNLAQFSAKGEKPVTK